MAFITMSRFDAVKADDAPTSWAEIDQSKIYKIVEIKTVNGYYGSCKFMKAEDANGNVIKFFAPNSMGKRIDELAESNERKDVYFMSLGQVFNKLDKSTHNKFDLVFEAGEKNLKDLYKD